MCVCGDKTQLEILALGSHLKHAELRKLALTLSYGHLS